MMRLPQPPSASQRCAGHGWGWAPGQVRSAALAWLLLALVLVPTVGQLHKVLHFAPHAGPGRAVVALHALGPDARGAAAGAVGAEAGAEALGACRTLGVDSENAPQRDQFLPDSPPHSGAMGQEDGKKWAAAAHSQPTIPKSDRLLGAISAGAAAVASEEDLSQGLRRLLPQHSTADCELLDQLALGQALLAAALVLPAALPPGAPAAPCCAGHMARHATAFQARGPPVR